jgi:hypothetical protein
MLSLVPELKKVPDVMKLDIKTDLINVIERARLQHRTPSFDPVPSHTHCFNVPVAHSSQQCSLYSMTDLPAKSRNVVYPTTSMSPSPSNSHYSAASSDSSFLDFSDDTTRQ